MNLDETTQEWAFRGCVILLFTVGWWVWNKAVSAIERITKDLRVMDKNISDYKLDAEKRFAKEDHVNENLNKVTAAVTALQNAINTNTNMTSVVMEKITSINERMKTQ